ncbi:MAG: NnrU family protein, partial [Gammaproteobacteria bacterium]
HGEAWDKFTAQTSYLPFMAIITGRNKLVISELNGKAALVGLGLFLLVLYFHQAWFGASPLP